MEDSPGSVADLKSVLLEVDVTKGAVAPRERCKRKERCI